MHRLLTMRQTHRPVFESRGILCTPIKDSHIANRMLLALLGDSTQPEPESGQLIRTVGGDWYLVLETDSPRVKHEQASVPDGTRVVVAAPIILDLWF